MKTKRLATLSLLTAIYVVLAMLVIQSVGFKFTLEAFPILVSAILFGPIDGLIVGALGSFLYQMFSYGLMPATILYVLPHALSGLVVGLYAKKKKTLNRKQYICIASISALLVTALNTLALYIQSNAEGWYSKTIVFGTLIPKIIIGIVLAIIYSAILPKLITYLKTKVAK